MNGKEIYCDLVFPLRLGVLTYKVPLELKDKLLPGMVVEAPLRRRLRRGIVLRLRDQFHGEALDLKGIVFRTPTLNKELLDLLEWASGYYLSEEGIVLKSMVPSFIFKKKRLQLFQGPQREEKSSTLIFATNSWDSPFVNYSATLIMEDILKTGRLLSLLKEYGKGGAIVMAPSLEEINRVISLLQTEYKDRIILYHSKLSEKEIERVYIRLMENSLNAPIVIGTRNVLFLPFKPSCIIVLDESSPFYKQEEAPYFNVRDVAVMRAYIEKVPVFLSSEAPSLESFYNARIGKYTLIESPERKINKSPVIISRIKKGFSSTGIDILPERLIAHIKGLLQKSQRILLLLPRTGYSLLYCKDCGRILRCECEGTLVYYKDEKILRCRICENEKGLPLLCPFCNGPGLEFRSAGIERIKEVLSGLVAKVRVMEGLRTEKENQDSLFISLSSKTCSLSDKPFDLAVILDADLFINMFAWRSGERLIQEVLSLRDKIKPDGQIIIQTRIPEYEIFKYLKRLDYKGFALSELRLRRLQGLPPYSRLILLKIFSKKPIDKKEIIQKLQTIPSSSVRELNIKIRKKVKAFQMGFLIRLKKGDLKEVKNIMELLKTQGINIRAEVDPF
jgi:primosomal protein N' (replication factor Y)